MWMNLCSNRVISKSKSAEIEVCLPETGAAIGCNRRCACKALVLILTLVLVCIKTGCVLLDWLRYYWQVYIGRNRKLFARNACRKCTSCARDGRSLHFWALHCIVCLFGLVIKWQRIEVQIEEEKARTKLVCSFSLQEIEGRGLNYVNENLWLPAGWSVGRSSSQQQLVNWSTGCRRRNWPSASCSLSFLQAKRKEKRKLECKQTDKLAEDPQSQLDWTDAAYNSSCRKLVVEQQNRQRHYWTVRQWKTNEMCHF